VYRKNHVPFIHGSMTLDREGSIENDSYVTFVEVERW